MLEKLHFECQITNEHDNNFYFQFNFSWMQNLSQIAKIDSCITVANSIFASTKGDE